MIRIEVPGRESFSIAHVALDFNGTIALDGALMPGVAERLLALSAIAEVHVLTADTFGSAARECTGTNAKLETFPSGAAAAQKRAIVDGLAGGVACVGNGFNDADMFDAADLSIAVVGGEGAWAGLLAHADIVTTSPIDALDLLLNPGRLKATLRW